MRLERAWLYNIVLDFLRRANAESLSRADIVYCSRFIEFLIDLTSQLPTSKWHSMVADPSVADALLDRIVGTAQQIALKGASMRKGDSAFWTWLGV